MFDPAQFDRKADFRGVYPNEINEELAWFVGRYLAQAVKGLTDQQKPRIAVARDGRTSSASIYSAVIQGIAAEGAVAVPAGLCTSDMIQWIVGYEGEDENLREVIAGAMITASHNPPEYNGIKMCCWNHADSTLEILRPVDHFKFRYESDGSDSTAIVPGPATPFPNQARLDLQEKFVRAACARSERIAEFEGKIVLDPGNGVGGILRRLLKYELCSRGATDKMEILEVAGHIDGSFPTRPSNPGLPGAVKLLQKTVVEEGAAFGAAFDGDADRIFIVDEKGDFVSGSLLLAVLAKNALMNADREKYGATPTIAYSAVCSWIVPQTVHAHGGRPVMTRVGQDSVKAGLVKTNAVFGGESSAHYNFPDTWCLDSGLFSLVDFWDILIASGKTCSELLAELNPWPNSGEVNLRFTCDDWKSVSAEVIANMKAEFDDPASDCYVLDLDGMTACHPKVEAFPTAVNLFLPDPENPDTEGIYRIVGDYNPDWWVNIRASNNEPLLRLNVESKGAPVEERTLALIERIREISKDVARVDVQDWGELTPPA